MKKSIFLLVLVSILISCSSSDVEDDSNPDNSSSVLLKISEVDGVSTYFTYDGNKLIKMSFSSGGYAVVTYTGLFITRIDLFDSNNTTNQFQTISYPNNKVIQWKEFYKNDLMEQRDFVYNADGTITVTSTKPNDGKTNISVYKHYFDSVGNIIKSENFDNNSLVGTSSYFYDTKNSPYKNIIGVNYFMFGGTNKNNLTKTTSTSTGSSNIYTSTFSYQYNNKDYPISCVATQYGKTTTTMYYY